MDTTSLPSSRLEALQQGALYFYTGLPCKKGHVAPRYTSSPMCVDCVRHNYTQRRDKTLAELKAKYRENPELYRRKEREAAAKNPKRYWAKNSLKNARIRAKRAGVPFSLTMQYLLTITPDTCPVFGITFTFVGNGSVCAESASLDRIIPAKGYVEDNVVVISNLANTIKSNVSAKEVARVAEWMYEQGL